MYTVEPMSDASLVWQSCDHIVVNPVPYSIALQGLCNF